MRYTTEYKPQISEECKTYISNQINEVFSFDSNKTKMYALDYVYETLSEEIEQNNGEEIFGISLDDMKVLKGLVDENVSYIEF